MATSDALREIFATARPLVEQWLDVAEQIAALRNVATDKGLDWSQLKALLKAQIQDERDETGDGKRVRKIVEKAEFASAYADMLGLAKMNENNFSAEDFGAESWSGVLTHDAVGNPIPTPAEWFAKKEIFDPETGEIQESGRAKIGRPIGSGKAQEFLREVAFVYEGDDCLIWPFERQENGYAQVRHEGRTRVASKVVCEHAHGPAPTERHHAAHSCGRGAEGCVAKLHLSWKTPEENEADKVAHGTSPRGEGNSNAKLTEAEVLEIRSLQGQLTTREIGERFGISHQAVSLIHNGRRWDAMALDESVVTNPEIPSQGEEVVTPPPSQTDSPAQSGDESAGTIPDDDIPAFLKADHPQPNPRCQKLKPDCKFSHHPQQITCSTCTSAWQIAQRKREAA